MSNETEPMFMPEGEARLWQAVLTLGQELAVARDRIDLLERALQAKRVLSPGEIETLPLDDEANASRDAARQALIARIVKPLRQR